MRTLHSPNIGFHGTVAELTTDFHAAIDHYIEVCKQEQEGIKDLVEAQPGSMKEIWDNEADEASWAVKQPGGRNRRDRRHPPGAEAAVKIIK